MVHFCFKALDVSAADYHPIRPAVKNASFNEENEEKHSNKELASFSDKPLSLAPNWFLRDRMSHLLWLLLVPISAFIQYVISL